LYPGLLFGTKNGAPTMLVKFDAEDEFVENLKSITGHNTASKAYQVAAATYVHQIETIGHLQSLVAKLREDVRVQRQIISSARDAAALLVEHTGQSDLFTDQPAYDLSAWGDAD
jgi:hypothetical protein